MGGDGKPLIPNYDRPRSRLTWDHLGSVNALYGDGHIGNILTIGAAENRSDPLRK